MEQGPAPTYRHAGNLEIPELIAGSLGSYFAHGVNSLPKLFII